jgi:hypothetical protein
MTPLTIARNDRRTVLPTAPKEPDEAEIESALLFLGRALTVEAVRSENRTDVAFEGEWLARRGGRREGDDRTSHLGLVAKKETRPKRPHARRHAASEVTEGRHLLISPLKSWSESDSHIIRPS